MAAAPDPSILAGRIQGFGNVNPPPIEEDTGATVAKRAVGRLGDMIGEEVMLTVEDFREKGAVGAVKDAVFDAGDILIDGVSGIFGWIRGDPPFEEDNGVATQAATHALSNGPTGAAYGVSQASPTGGINAVWVMPEDADPAALASLSQQAGGLSSQQQDPRVPKNIQPYEPPPSSNDFTPAPIHAPSQMPGGITIAPYEPAPAGLFADRAPSFAPTAGQSALQECRWGPGGYSFASGGSGSSSAGVGGATGGGAGSKAFVDRIAKGEVLVGPDAAKRLVSQCNANKTSAKQLAEMVCERIRHLYLGLDGADPADADEALTQLLGLADALAAMDSEFTSEVVKNIRDGAFEELSSLRSSAKHKDIAEPMLCRLAAKAEPSMTDLLGGDEHAASSSAPVADSAQADLLGAPEQANPTADSEADLLGGISAEEDAIEADLLGASTLASNAASDMASLDPMLAPAAPDTASTGSSLLAGLTLDSSAEPVPLVTASLSATDTAAASVPTDAADLAGAAALDALAAESSKKEKNDAFDFVGSELSKAQSPA